MTTTTIIEAESFDLQPSPSVVTARVLRDSVSPAGHRLTTVEARFPRSVLGHVLAYRAFSRNSASMRAIPIRKVIEEVLHDPYIPRKFSLKHRGMNTDSYIEPGDPEWPTVVQWWLEGRDRAVNEARRGLELGLHKQVVNRLLEPYLMHTSIVSSTTWENFFDQRLAVDEDGNPLADIPVYDLAVAVRDVLAASTPAQLGVGEWHLPLTGFPGDEHLDLPNLLRVSVARVARVSYLTHDGRRDVEADLDLFDRLLFPGPDSGPHLSPFEPPAHPLRPDQYSGSNFEGWLQARKYVEVGDLSPFGLPATVVVGASRGGR